MRTELVEHVNDTVGEPLVRQKAYRVPYSQKDTFSDSWSGQAIYESMGIPSGVSPKERRRNSFLCRLPNRQLNTEAIFDAYPIPRVEIFHSVGATRVMSTLDLAKGYWQVPMSSSCRKKTTFATPFGLYEFEVMPFGLHNAPATFQRLMTMY